MLSRCPWCLAHPLLTDYHDREWGVPRPDDNAQFEHLLYEIFQAGLSWLTILKRREVFREVFAGFDPVLLAQWEAGRVEKLLQDRRLIRNRAKIEAVINNARHFLEIRAEFGCFSTFISRYKPKKRLSYNFESEIPVQTPEATALSQELKRRGFKFVGPTICYAHIQAVGLVNDHLTTCFRYKEVAEMQSKENLNS
ncbi:MAG: DNA-3-methyladenine glycosylase I [Calditrichaeota bacterium]|nr:DNA-3-methyladenine glycosylase I [Calditrichota bacterium]